MIARRLSYNSSQRIVDNTVFQRVCADERKCFCVCQSVNFYIHAILNSKHVCFKIFVLSRINQMSSCQQPAVSRMDSDFRCRVTFHSALFTASTFAVHISAH